MEVVRDTLLGLVAGVFYPTEGKVISFSEKYGYVSALSLYFLEIRYIVI